MLEYMLCRPQDSCFFGPALRTVVLDEAHLYTGALAGEIRLLLRRLNERCDRSAGEILHLATSATMGAGDENQLKDFVARLFSKSRSSVQIRHGDILRPVMGRAVAPQTAPTAVQIAKAPWPDGATLHYKSDGTPIFPELSDDERDKWLRSLALLVGAEALMHFSTPMQAAVAPKLFEVLRASPVIHRLEKALADEPRMPLIKLSQRLFNSSGEMEKEATRRLLTLAAAARPEPTAYPLVPARIHLVVRAPTGLTAFPAAGATGCDGWRFEAGRNDRSALNTDFGLEVWRCQECGEWHLAGAMHGPQMIFPPPGGTASSTLLDFFSPVEISGATLIRFDPVTRGIGGDGAPGVSLWRIGSPDYGCRHCGANLREAARPFVSAYGLAQSIAAETLLAGLPELASTSVSWLPARGRRLLAFSDSRSEAARLGLRLTRQHEIQLFRAALVDAVPRINSDSPENVAYLESEIAQKQQAQMRFSTNPTLQERIRGEIEALEKQLRQARIGGSVDDWRIALLQIPFLGELMDLDGGKKHRVATWSQSFWELNQKAAAERIPLLLAREFASRPKWPTLSLETAGLIEVTYPALADCRMPASFSGLLPNDTVRAGLSKCWPDMLALLLDTVRRDGAVTLGSDDEDRNYLLGEGFIGKWMAKDQAFGSRLLRFIGQRDDQRRRKFTLDLLAAGGVAETSRNGLANELLSTAFDQIFEKGKDLGWLETDMARQAENGGVPAFRLRFKQLALRPAVQVWRCRRTGQVWPRVALGCVPAASKLDLQQIQAAELDSDPRLGRARREWRTSEAFRIGIWAEEHSAQLDPGENRRLQDLFKAGIRNILSSTTTLELGIDIGGLQGVFLGNLPPGKASYLQRAGRAGRRADGSSLVVGFARSLPYDQEVFRNFGDFLAKPLRRPTILDRERFARHHAAAWLFGRFFRMVYPSARAVGAMSAFGYMGRFCGSDRTDYWKPGHPKPVLDPCATDWRLPSDATWAKPNAVGLADHLVAWLLSLVKEMPNEISHPLGEILEDTDIDCAKQPLSATISKIADEFQKAVEGWQKDYETLLSQWKAVPANSEDTRLANALHHQLGTFYGLTVIESLADARVLPRYGFPIGLQRLRVVNVDEKNPQRIREEDQFRLERSGLLALREYVPGSQLLAGGRLITSRGLLKHWAGGDADAGLGLTGLLAVCAAGHSFYSFTGDVGQCPACHAAPVGLPQRMLIPRFGFTTAAWDPPRISSDVERVGSVQRMTLAFRDETRAKKIEPLANIGSLIGSFRADGEIVLTNSGEHGEGFAICQSCGCAESERSHGAGRDGLPPGFEQHSPLFDPTEKRWCWRPNTAPVWRNFVLAARQTTDLALIDFSTWLRGDNADHRALLRGINQALKLAGARLLELDPRELVAMDDLPWGVQGSGLAAAICDAASGGAGHVQELICQRAREWLEMARKVLFVDETHHSRCETGCLACILSFDATDAAATGGFKRREAWGLLDALLSGKPPPPFVVPAVPTADFGTSAPARPKADRVARAHERGADAKQHRQSK